MFLKAAKLEHVFASIFSHFSANTGSPFNFLSESLRENLFPSTFGGDVLQLALAFQRFTKDQDVKQDATQLFDRLVPTIAYCIVLDVERCDRLGLLITNKRLQEREEEKS